MNVGQKLERIRRKPFFSQGPSNERKTIVNDCSSFSVIFDFSSWRKGIPVFLCPYWGVFEHKHPFFSFFIPSLLKLREAHSFQSHIKEELYDSYMSRRERQESNTLVIAEWA